jgi:protein-tyrosine-phosphatase/tRNA A37 threonylcarbamoyladenosine synthetase subunit TsaC/SUA5/YrdC
MPTVLEWSPSTEPEGFVRQVQGSLTAGQAVLLPTRSGFVALVNPSAPAAYAQLDSLRKLGGSTPSLLAFGPEDVAALGLALPRPAARLMERTWPGPVTIALPVAKELAVPKEWTEPVRAAVATKGLIRFRCPDHAIFDTLFVAQGPATLVVDLPDCEPKTVADALGESAGLLIFGGQPAKFLRPTVVQVDGKSCSVLEDGFVPAADIEKLTARLILFVCTGNTCRSPMAEALAKRLLADRLNCSLDELPAHGYWVMSAGVAAYGGDAASEEAVKVVAAMGADLARHESRPVNPQILAAADDVIAMTHSHAAALAMRYPGFGPPARLLCGDDDLVDPIGGNADVYRECARTIHTHLERLVTEWVAS